MYTYTSINFIQNQEFLSFSFLWISVVQWLASGTPTRTIQVPFPSDLLLHHGDNRGRYSTNHNLLPDMHLLVPVLRVKMCHDSRLISEIREGNW